MNWEDKGIILSVQKYGEGYLIVKVLTHYHGRSAGLVYAGARKEAGIMPGTLTNAVWQARLESHLGRWRLEPTYNPTALIMHQPLTLTLVSAACALCDAFLPERHPYAALYEKLEHMLTSTLSGPSEKLVEAYVFFELDLLSQMGFGLELTQCAIGGEKENLAYVSPKSGRAVCAREGEPYQGRLLELPSFILGKGEATWTELKKGLALTRYFLQKHLAGPSGIPHARERLEELVKG